jgi:AraC family transcriptional regulator
MASRFLATPEDVDAMFSAPPIVSTDGFCWQGLHLDCRWEPAAEMEEVSAPWPSILLFTQLPEPTVAERRLDGCFKVEQVHPGDVIILPAQVGHGCRWHAAGEFINLVFDPFRLGQSLETTAAELVPHFATQDLLVLQIGLTLKRLLQSGHSDRLYAESLASTLAIHLLQNYAQHPPVLKTYTGGLGQSHLQSVLDYIHDHLQADLSLETLAALVPMSPHYFAQLFKQSVGLSPHQYVIRRRVERAQTLLRQVTLPIADIAYQVGFANQSHLNRHFKRLVGVTPGTWRRR